MPAAFYHALAIAALLVHLLWILWIIFGYLLARRQPLLRWLHLGSLVYALGVTLADWHCPLTLAEQWAHRRAGLATYEGSFLVHYLNMLVYPDLPLRLLTTAAVAVCLANLILHARCFLLSRCGTGG